MRAPGPPVRFLIAVIGLWVVARATMLTMGNEEAAEDVAAEVARVSVAPMRPSLPQAFVEAAAPQSPSPPRRQGPIALAAGDGGRIGRHGFLPAQGRRAEVVRPTELAGTLPPAEPTFTPAPDPPRGLAAAPVAAVRSRWSGSIFLFARDGSGGVPLAGGGQLSGSQTGARIAYRLDEAGRLAAAARLYAPIDSLRGSEAAVGIDLRPLPDVPFRLSVERRIAVGRDGRDAWSAYAAGGFFRGVGRAVELDGYAQTGIVGTKSRDLFADGALRVARRFELGGNRVVLVGVGAWGAAQPGVARLDVGPRVTLRLPAAGTTVSVAAEWRERVAGDARPRSGPALTVAADF